MRPRIICHMLSSIDGRIDGAALKNVVSGKEYEDTGSKLGGDAWICGRVTMQQHFSEVGHFKPRSEESIGEYTSHIALKADSYAIAVDTHGSLLWDGGDLDGEHLICILSENAPAEYLEYLRENGISYIAAGAAGVDLEKAATTLHEAFGINTLLLEGGGHINGAFLQAGLVDEVSLLLAPGIDGRPEVPSVFDGVVATAKSAVALQLKSVQQLDNGVLWLRYDVSGGE